MPPRPIDPTDPDAQSDAILGGTPSVWLDDQAGAIWSGGLQRSLGIAQVTLTAAQIAALASGVALIPSPGLDRSIIVLGLQAELKFGTMVFSDPDWTAISGEGNPLVVGFPSQLAAGTAPSALYGNLVTAPAWPA